MGQWFLASARALPHNGGSGIIWHIRQFCYWQNHGCCHLRLRKPSTDLRNRCTIGSYQHQNELPELCPERILSGMFLLMDVVSAIR